jgi:hypothetical protein
MHSFVLLSENSMLPSESSTIPVVIDKTVDDAPDVPFARPATVMPVDVPDHHFWIRLLCESVIYSELFESNAKP